MRVLVAWIGSALLGTSAASAESSRAPFRDLNEIVTIAREGQTIRFDTPNGLLRFDPRDESWDVVVNDAEGPPPADVPGVDCRDPRQPSPLPAWYECSSYTAVVARQDADAWLLVSRADEGVYPSGDHVVDVAGRTVYALPPQRSRALLVTDSDVWVGHARGVTRIRRATGRRNDYVALPNAREISGWVENRGVRYVTTTDGALLALAPSGEISLLSPPPELLRVHDAAYDFGYESPWSADLRWRFTNPVVRGDGLYFGAFAGDWAWHWPQTDSLLLRYGLADGAWSARLLPPKMRVRKLLEERGRLWLLGNWVFWGEGGELSDWGGIAELTADDRIVEVRGCAGIPIVSWLAEEEAISFLGATGEPRFLRHSRCTIGLAEPLYTPKWRALATGSPEIAQHPPRTFQLSEAEREGLSSWRVRPSVVAVEGRSVEILRFPVQ
jgi:hypothetical protein